MNDTAAIRKRNMLKIIEVMRTSPPLSRPEIAAATSLTTMTVTTLTAELLRLNLILEQGIQHSKGGRKAVLYGLNAESKLIVGVNVQIDRAFVDVFDLRGDKTGDGIVVRLPCGESASLCLASIADAIKGAIADHQKTKTDILGIGVTVPGQTNHRTGVVYNLTNMPKWRNVPVKDILEKQLKIPVFVEKDTNSHITCLKLSNKIEQTPYMAYLAIDEGIGASVIINNRVYHGAHGIAGEAGHMTLDIDGKQCNCNNKGCVEVFASHSAIIEAYALERDRLNGVKVKDVLGNRSLENEFILTLAEYSDVDAAANRAFKNAVRYLSACVVNIINLYDPSVVIIECKWMRRALKYFQMLVDGVYERCGFLNGGTKILMNPIENIFEASTYTVVWERALTELDNNLFFR